MTALAGAAAGIIETTRSTRRAHRIYRVSDGTNLPSVTTIIGLRAKNLTEWAFRIGKEHPELGSIREYTNDLASVGTLVHHFVDRRLRGASPDLDDFTPNELKAARPSIDMFDQWLARRRLHVIATEHALVSERERFGGTVDLFAEIDGRRAVLDIKTSRGIYHEQIYQVAAYAELLRENGERVDQVRILRLGRIDVTLEERSLDEWESYWKAFLALRDLYEAERAIRRYE